MLCHCGASGVAADVSKLKISFRLPPGARRSALAIYSAMVWNVLQLTFPEPHTAVVKGARSVARLSTASRHTVGLVFLTALSGAFVAGMDAGLVYNEVSGCPYVQHATCLSGGLISDVAL